MSFGCGKGIKDRAVLEAISSRLPHQTNIVYHAIDPEASQIERFKKDVVNQTFSGMINDSLEKINFGFFTKKYEDYMRDKYEDPSFSSKADLLLFIDSLCHFSTTSEDVLVHCYDNVLAPNGVILLTLWNDQDFWFKIRDVYGKGRNSKRDTEEGNDYLTVQEVELMVKKHGWKSKLVFLEYSLDITECFNLSSNTGKHLLECLACFSNVKDEVDSNPKKLLDFLKESQTMNENKQLLKGMHGILLIFKV